MNRSEAFDILRDEMHQALMKDGRIVISTPSYNTCGKRNTVASIVASEMDELTVVKVLRILAAAAKAGDADALSLIDGWTKTHADWHCDAWTQEEAA